ncbi:hypothetical protein KUTeg_001567 [Tegillarca granosa]|uniref:G-protein coupled receptors family 1 profile domain-containing protein n=1 Tax=Tegillarca granosa TaxID=220873 RepID=A0ABQ9FW61_TEGGR|nr:hypothetical protein KUTeg_001567 [Tegillarca granosa]
MASTEIAVIYSNVTVNNSVFNNTSKYRNESLALIEIAVQAAIFTVAFFGNAIVILTLCLRKKKLTQMHVLMIHLSVADLFVAFCNVLPQLIWDITDVFHGGDFLCRLVKYLQVVAIYASAYVLVVTALDRYIAICHPFLSQKWSSSRVHYMVIVAWVLSMLFSIPQVIIFSIQERQAGEYDCWATFYPNWTLQLYITCFTVSVYIAPTLILIVCYGLICYTVWRRGRVGENCSKRTWQSSDVRQSSGSAENQCLSSNGSVHLKREAGISRAKKRTIRLTLTVVLCYVICWSPFFISQMWAAYDENAPFKTNMYGNQSVA